MPNRVKAGIGVARARYPTVNLEEKTMIHILARLSFQPDKAPAAREALEALVLASRKEAGCHSYRLLQQCDAPYVLQTVEEWADEAAADGHMQTPHVVAALAAIVPLFAEPPDIVRFQKVL